MASVKYTFTISTTFVLRMQHTHVNLAVFISSILSIYELLLTMHSTVLKLILYAGLRDHTINTFAAIVDGEVAEGVNVPAKELGAFACSVHRSGVPHQCSENLSCHRPTFRSLVKNLDWNQKPSYGYCYVDFSVGFCILLQGPHCYLNLKPARSPFKNRHAWRPFASKS